jgi:phosphatidylinositol alpha-1,6-mannosyltransferase
MTKKTLLISEIFPPIHGGSGRWFWELYTRLPRDEYLIAAGETESDTEFDQTHDLNLSRLPLSSKSWGLKSLSGLKFYWRNFLIIRSLIKKNKIRQIHCGRCLPEGVFGLMMKIIYNIPYICYIHGEDVETASSSRELSFIVKQVLKKACKLIANSKNSRSILIDHWDVPIEKIAVLNPGMDANKFVPTEYDKVVRKKLGWNDRPVLLTVGRLQKRKGQDMLIKAMPQIIEQHPDVLYAIVGGGEEKDNLKKLVTELSLNNNVQFLSEIPDETMIQCYQQCTLFVLPNRTIGKDIEGFGMVLAEAQSCGKPVLAGDSGGTAETMIIGETGYIVDCSRPEPIALGIINILQHQEKSLTMGKKGREHAVKDLDWRVHINKSVSVFSSIT